MTWKQREREKERKLNQRTHIRSGEIQNIN
jgi:hypothetical protein